MTSTPATAAHFRPPVPQAVTIAGPAGPLEARCEDPLPAGGAARAVGVVCHPHPLHGGTMQNKVVHTLARAMQECGVPTVRFNFRGVGRSAGTYADGIGELDDALATIAWAREHWQCETLWLGGFSFGAAVALNAQARVHPARLAVVAPPVGRLAVSTLAPPACPWLVVQGDRDDLVSCADVRRWCEGFTANPPRLVVMNEAEHFFHGRLGELRGEAIRFLSGGEVAAGSE